MGILYCAITMGFRKIGHIYVHIIYGAPFFSCDIQ